MDEIEAAGAGAVARADDRPAGRPPAVRAALDAFGRFDVLAANPGSLRDRVLVTMAAGGGT